MGVLFIMLLHGVPVYLCGVLTNSRLALMIAAVVSCVIGVFTGVPKYLPADIFSVFIAYLIADEVISNHSVNTSISDKTEILLPGSSQTREQLKRSVRNNRYL